MLEQIAYPVDAKESAVAIRVTTVVEMLGRATIIRVKKLSKLIHCSLISTASQLEALREVKAFIINGRSTRI
jgi:hypothetical protein